MNDIIFYQFSRAKVERGDFSAFLNLYSPEKLPAGRRLRDMMNTFAFAIEGWDDDPRELYSIPEIRKFYTAFRNAWPYWLYFCNLESESLQIMVLCSLPSFESVKKDHQPRVIVEPKTEEVLAFLRANYGPMKILCGRGGMYDRAITERRIAILTCFNLPLDSQLE